jgi:hypothetical protein
MDINKSEEVILQNGNIPPSTVGIPLTTEQTIGLWKTKIIMERQKPF